MGSATPSLESFARAGNKVYKLLVLSKRPSSSTMPNVEIIDMKEEVKKAQEAVWYNTDCKLLTKEEYEELCKYKALYLDLKGSLEGIVKDFKQSA